jgi:hypothetical protein
MTVRQRRLNSKVLASSPYLHSKFCMSRSTRVSMPLIVRSDHQKIAAILSSRPVRSLASRPLAVPQPYHPV